MAGQLKLRRGTTSQLANYIGSEGELTYDTALKSLVLHDGVTLGGVKIPYLSNDLVPSTMLPTATESVVGASKIATTAIAQAGVNDTDIITALKLQQKINNVSFGINQGLSNPTTLANTWYTNTSGKVMFAHKMQGGVDHSVVITVRVGSTEYSFNSGSAGNKVSATASVMAIIPIGAEYKCNYTNMMIFS